MVPFEANSNTELDFKRGLGGFSYWCWLDGAQDEIRMVFLDVKILQLLILHCLLTYSIFSSRFFFQSIFLINNADESTVDDGSNYCRAKGK